MPKEGPVLNAVGDLKAADGKGKAMPNAAGLAGLSAHSSGRCGRWWLREQRGF
jgi:hypothetical protein